MNENPNESEVRSQNRRILAHLQQGGSITGIEALTKFGCFRLPSRICDIRKMGHAIASEFVKLPNGKRVKRYRLAEVS
ncbi:MAG: helix-turn-helix domain-containing protein [Alistipes sp.]|nr:helix-turn-helix domain-containing protein [Alistipes sp.]